MSIIMRRPIGSISVLFVVVMGLVAHGKLVSHSPQGAMPVAIVANQSAQAERDELEIERITLRPEGFEPMRIARPRGTFLLLIEDRSGNESSSLRLQAVKGEWLKDINTNRKKSKQYDTLNLPPGDYVLTEVANAQRGCQITIQP